MSAYVFCHPVWKTDEGKSKAMEKVRELCEKVKAKRVIMITDTFTNRFEGNEKKTTDALCISLETSKKSKNMELVSQPYTIDNDGNISFGEEIWITKTDKYPSLATCEGLVQ